MFQDYLEDASKFYQLAEEKKSIGDEREAKMFYRAAVFCATSSLEAFINLIGNTFEHGNNLDKIEIAFLNDKVLELSASKASIEEKIKFNTIDSKLKFIIKKFNVALDLSIAFQWRDFIAFKDLRNSLIHSKSIDDEISTAEYSINIKKGLNANIDIMNAVSIKLFSKSLRRGLNDLKL